MLEMKPRETWRKARSRKHDIMISESRGGMIRPDWRWIVHTMLIISCASWNASLPILGQALALLPPRAKRKRLLISTVSRQSNLEHAGPWPDP